MSRSSAMARCWLATFLAGYVVLAILAIFALLTPVPYGDLTRIGLFSERDFGWTLSQPRIEPALLRGSPIDRADILVIGDSFSAPHVWQSSLVKAGYGVATVHWDSFDESLCRDVDDWVRASGFRGRLIIIQSVERALKIRLGLMQRCDRMARALASRTEPRATMPVDPPPFAIHWNVKLSSGWHLLRHSWRARSAAEAAKGFGTTARRVADGCAMFSHRLCDKALFFRDDDLVGELTRSEVDAMQDFSRTRTAAPVLWLIIPDKTTTYIRPTHSHSFAEALRTSGLGPDLFAFAAAHKTRIRDFYLPNDTHLSHRGLLALGEHVLQDVQQRLGMACCAPAS